MAERDSLWVTGLLDQEEARVGTGALIVPATNAVKAKTGLRPASGNPGAVTATGTPDANVHVAPFQAILQSGRGATAGIYIMTLDATKDINILSTPAHASNPRNDLIIAHQSDAFYGDGSSAMSVRQVVGTPSGSPADPSLASFPDSITLARVRVNANATTITSGNITDLRPAYTVALGGLLPVASQTLRNALTGVYDGMQIYRTDRDWVEVYDGVVWRVTGVAVVSSTGDMSAITGPFAGQLAYNTGDGMIYRYTGSAWRVRGTYSVTQTLASTTASVTFSSIPTYLRVLTLSMTACATGGSGAVTIQLQVNGDSSALYSGQYQSIVNATINTGNSSSVSSARVGASVIGATKWAICNVDISGWNAPHTGLSMLSRAEFYDTAANSFLEHSGWQYTGASPYTSLTVAPNAGSWSSGSQFTLTGIE